MLQVDYHKYQQKHEAMLMSSTIIMHNLTLIPQIYCYQENVKIQVEKTKVHMQINETMTYSEKKIAIIAFQDTIQHHRATIPHSTKQYQVNTPTARINLKFLEFT